MSRCFPYPPPGYVRNGASGVALIESIKKEKVKAEIERKERKREKKERKREEKEKRREKKGEKSDVKRRKEKEGDKSDGKGKRVSEKNHQGDSSSVLSKEIHRQKKTGNVADQLDKSDVTEEHGQPNYLGNICYSSDGTQSGIKRKRDALPSNSNHSNGDIIQIRSPLVQNTKRDAPLCKEQPSSKAGIVDTCSRELPRSQILQLRGQEQGCSTSTKPKFETTELSNRTHGDIIRIRVPLVKNTDTPRGKEQSCTKLELPKSQLSQLRSQEQSCSTSTRPNFKAQKCTPKIDDPKLLPPTSVKTESLLLNNGTVSKSISLKMKSIEKGTSPTIDDPKLLPSTSGKTESLPLGSNGTISKSISLKKKSIEIESLYKSLIENWVPMPLHHEPPADCDDDQQWLFERKRQNNHDKKRLKPINDVLCYNISSFGPKAQYLPEADIYALPYTIPF